MFLSVEDAERSGQGHPEEAPHPRGPRVLLCMQPETLRHLQVLPKGGCLLCPWCDGGAPSVYVLVLLVDK